MANAWAHDTAGVPSAVSSAQWQQVARDPLVQRVKEAVDGTLFDVRPVNSVKDADATVDEPDENGDGDA